MSHIYDGKNYKIYYDIEDIDTIAIALLFSIIIRNIIVEQ